MNRRPTVTDPRTGADARCTTPNAAALIGALGGARSESVMLSGDEFRALRKLYGYTPEGANERPPPPVDPGPSASYSACADYKAAKRGWDRWEDPRPMMQAGADRNMLRFAGCDGMRVIAWIARHIERGSDPLKAIVQLASDAGWDVDAGDLGWASADEEEGS